MTDQEAVAPHLRLRLPPVALDPVARGVEASCLLDPVAPMWRRAPVPLPSHLHGTACRDRAAPRVTGHLPDHPLDLQGLLVGARGKAAHDSRVTAWLKTC